MAKLMLHKKGTPPVKAPSAPAASGKVVMLTPQMPSSPPPAAEPAGSHDREVAELYHAELDARKDQIYAYAEFVHTLNGDWTLSDAAEMLMILVRSIFYDACAIVVCDESGSNFEKPVCRGFRYTPGRQILENWRQTLSGGRVNWDALIETLNAPSSISMWLAAEGFYACGYVPVRTGKTIKGFLLVGSREGHAADDFSNLMLELFAAGLASALQLKVKTPAESSVSAESLQKTEGLAPSALEPLRARLSAAQDYAHILKNAGVLSADQVSLSAQGCFEMVKEANRTLQSLLDS